MNKIYNYKIKNIFILIKTLYHSLIVLFVHTSWLSSGFKERFKKLNTINYAQKKITNAIPYWRGITTKLSNNAARKGIQLSMKPNQVNFIRIKTDKDAIKQEKKSDI